MTRTFGTHVVLLCVALALALTFPATAQAMPLAGPATSDSPALNSIIDSVDGEAIHYNDGRTDGPDSGTGTQWQCVELVQRYFHNKWNIADHWPIGLPAYNMIDHLPSGVVATRNGNSPLPQPGDALVFAKSSSWPFGHVAIVTDVRGGRIYFAQQNVETATRDSVPIDGTSVGSNGEHVTKYPTVLGWVHANANTGSQTSSRAPTTTTTPGGQPAPGSGPQGTRNPNFVCLGGSVCSPAGGSQPNGLNPQNFPTTSVCALGQDLVGGHCVTNQTACEAAGYECSNRQEQCRHDQERGSDGHCYDIKKCDHDQYWDHGQCKPKPIECAHNQVADRHGGCKDKPQGQNACRHDQVRGPDGKCSDKQKDCPHGQARGAHGECSDVPTKTKKSSNSTDSCPNGMVRVSPETDTSSGCAPAGNKHKDPQKQKQPQQRHNPDNSG